MEEEKEVSVLFVGVGGVGGFFGGSLASKSRVRVTFLGRKGSSHTKKLQEEGLTLESIDKKMRENIKIEVVESLREESRYDAIFLCTKTFHLDEAAVEVKKVVKEDTLVIPLVNGIAPTGI